jgi:CheY-like chemotaxis protein
MVHMATILVVDDDEVTLVLVGEMLASVGHQVVTARHGRDALEIMDQRKDIEVVITDLRMPHVSGLRLIRDRRDAGDTIPIIAISGVNADQLILAEDYGANAALLKPIDRTKLLAAVDRVLEESKDNWTGAWIQPDLGPDEEA